MVVTTVLQIPHIILRAGISAEIKRIIEAERTSAIAAFEAIKEIFDGTDTKLRHVIRQGHCGEEICELAANENVELVVIGAKGRSTLDRLLLGSTSDYVSNHAKCSVLVVRPSEIQRENQRFQITIGYHDTEAARRAVEEFKQANWTIQTEVHLVSTISLLSSFQTEIVVDTDSIVQAATHALLEAKDSLAQLGINATTQLIKADHIADSLVEYAEQHRCDLMVVGQNQNNRLGRMLMGSVSRFVMRYASCSVWITRN